MSQVLKAGHAVVGEGSAPRPNTVISSWTPRYVVLTGTCISVYTDLNAMQKPLFSVVIIPESTTQVTGVDIDDFAGALGSAEYRVFVRDPPGNHFFMTFSSSREQLGWIDAIRKAIRLSRFALKAYISTTGQKGILKMRQRRYFVLEDKIITRHRDYDRVWEIEDSFKFSFSTLTLYTDDTNTILLTNRGGGDNSLELSFDDNRAEYLKWKDMIGKMITATEEKVEGIKVAMAESIKRARMYYRFDLHGGQGEWRECCVALTETSLILQEDEPGAANSPVAATVRFDPAKCIDILDFSPDSNCIATSESLCSFHVTNRGKMVRLRESCTHEMKTWIKAINRCIAHSAPRKRDEILSTAVRLIKDDVFYSVTVNQAGPMGFDLDARGDGWVVASSTRPDSGISKGSVLTSIGRKNVLLLPAADILTEFVDWSPPLTLHFRKAPEKAGYLFEKINGSLGSKWRKSYFRMACGQLERHESHHSVATNVFPLIGAAVFEIKEDKEGTRRILSFRFVAGSDSLLLQAETSEELLSWMGFMCHGIAIANGGSYVRRVEMNRISRLARMKQKGYTHRRQSTRGMLANRSASELSTFSYQGDDDAHPGHASGDHSSLGHDHLHEEEQWWSAMGGSSGDLIELLLTARHDHEDGESVGSSATRDAAGDLLKDANFYTKQSTEAGAVSVDRTSSSQVSGTSRSTKLFEEQQRIQGQINRIHGDSAASQEVVVAALRQRIEDFNVSFDSSELEAAVSMAELWGVEGAERDRAVELLRSASSFHSPTPEKRSPPNVPKLALKSPKTFVNRNPAEFVAVRRQVGKALAEYPEHAPCSLTYPWSADLKSNVEGALTKGNFLLSNAKFYGKVENWKGCEGRSYSRHTDHSSLPCVENTKIIDEVDGIKYFIMNSCVQVYLNHIFIRELVQDSTGKMVLLGDSEDTGLLISHYDQISVCDVDSHHSIIIRVNLHASSDIATSCAPKNSHVQGSPSTNSDCSDEAPVPVRPENRPVVRWIGGRDGKLFSNMKSVLSTYLGRSQKLIDMQRSYSGEMAPLVETFSNIVDGAILEDVNYADLHLQTAPEGRLEFEIECGSLLERDALFLALFYLVPAGRARSDIEQPMDRDLSIRDRIRCLPWNHVAEVVAADNLNGHKYQKKTLAECEETIHKLQAEISHLKCKHAKEMKAKDEELFALRDQVNGRLGIL